MSLATLLANTETMPIKELTDTEKIEQVYQVFKDLPPGALRWIFVLSIISVVGILWLVHRQHRLARNQVKLAAMVEEISKRSGQ